MKTQENELLYKLSKAIQNLMQAIDCSLDIIVESEAKLLYKVIKEEDSSEIPPYFIKAVSQLIDAIYKGVARSSIQEASHLINLINKNNDSKS